MKANADLLPAVQEFCRQNGLLPSEGRIIVGLSGGPDSLALLDLLHRLAPRLGLSVAAAHLNHGLRGAAADADEAAVRRICSAYGIPLHVGHRDIRAAAAERCQGIEEAGRRIRYEFFESVARNELAAAAGRPAGFAHPEERHVLYREPGITHHDAGITPREPGITPREPGDGTGEAGNPAVAGTEALLKAGIRIAVGHHRNDQAETMLLNLGRGSGIDGLSGMRPRNGLIIRPLLESAREDIDAYVRWRGLEPCLDASNLEMAATRNRLRHRVLPALSEAFGFDAVPPLARAARLLRQDADCLNQLAAEALAQLRESARTLPGGPLSLHGQSAAFPNQVAALPVQEAATLHPAILGRVLRLWYRESFGEMRDLAESQVAGLAGLCQAGRSGRRCSLPHGREAVRSFDWLVLLAPPPSPDGDSSSGDRTVGSSDISEAAEAHGASGEGESPVEARPLLIPGTTEIPGGGHFVTQFIVAQAQIVYNYRTWCFPASELAGAVVRRRRPHDRFRAEGAHGRLLKKLLCERQVPAGLRDRLPLIARDGTVLWIPGVAASGRLPATPADGGIPPGEWILVRYNRPEAAADGPASSMEAPGPADAPGTGR